MSFLCIVIRVLGFAVGGLTAAFLVRPEWMLPIVHYLKRGRNVYWAGLVQLVLGGIFVLGRNSCKEPEIIAFLGLLMLLETIMIFLFGPRRMAPILAWYELQPRTTLRVMFLLLLGIWILVVMSA